MPHSAAAVSGDWLHSSVNDAVSAEVVIDTTGAKNDDYSCKTIPIANDLTKVKANQIKVGNHSCHYETHAVESFSLTDWSLGAIGLMQG